MKPHGLLGVALVAALGCGGGAAKVVPISGVVTLDGKPLVGASVAFSPIARPGETNAGDGSAGKTNEKGEFTLTTSRGVPGAQVGKHRVSISLLIQQAATAEERLRGGAPMHNTIPARYNADSQLTFDVPAAGSTAANFDLISK